MEGHSAAAAEQEERQLTGSCQTVAGEIQGPAQTLEVHCRYPVRRQTAVSVSLRHLDMEDVAFQSSSPPHVSHRSMALFTASPILQTRSIFNDSFSEQDGKQRLLAWMNRNKQIPMRKAGTLYLMPRLVRVACSYLELRHAISDLQCLARCHIAAQRSACTRQTKLSPGRVGAEASASRLLLACIFYWA